MRPRRVDPDDLAQRLVDLADGIDDVPLEVLRHFALKVESLERLADEHRPRP